MTNEIYEPWYCANLSSPMRIVLKGVSYQANGSLDIHACNIKRHDQQLTIRFPEVIAMRITNESQRLATLNGMEGHFSHCLCLVQNSNFLAWLNRDSLGVYEDAPWRHFSITEDNEWLDVIAVDFPEVTVTAAP
ncbi:MAG: hypothetical protein PHU14_03830 [Methylovulum sp.]|nr:hypothetical protein [Methylovulum sp.]